MVKTKSFALLILLLLTPWASISAQQGQVSPTEVTETEVENQGEQEAGSDSEPDSAEGEIEEGEEEEEESRRFIPTEEISQDLGVSFPRDI